MLWKQTHFLKELTVHRLLWGLASINPSLRELPTVGANAFSPENLIALVEQHNADIGSKAVPVKHNQASNF
jgi:hypothetical protein